MNKCRIAGTQLTLVGYGITKNYAPYQYSDVPTKGKIIPLTYEECLRHLGPASITRYTLCSSNKVGLAGPCGGDPGAPLFLINEKDGTRSQVGHVTGGDGATFGRCDNGTYWYVDFAPFVGCIHRRISGCGNYPINTIFKTATPIPCEL